MPSGIASESKGLHAAIALCFSSFRVRANLLARLVMTAYSKCPALLKLKPVHRLALPIARDPPLRLGYP
jgi:hypothetical protein